MDVPEPSVFRTASLASQGTRSGRLGEVHPATLADSQPPCDPNNSSCSDVCGGAIDVRAIYRRDDRPEETRAGRDDRPVDLHCRETAEWLSRRELLPRPKGRGHLLKPVGVAGGVAGAPGHRLL